MKIVVTGGAGFIGSHLVDELLRQGAQEVLVVDNLHRGRIEFLDRHLIKGAITFVEGDVRDRCLLAKVFEGAGTVFHLAAQSNVLRAVADLDYTFSTNVAGTFNVLYEAAKSSVRRVVFTSSREVYGEPASLPVNEEARLEAKNPYGASKIAGEICAQEYARAGLEVVVLRLANVYGRRDSERVIPLFINKILLGDPLIVYGENKMLDFIWIEDVVKVLVKAGLDTRWIREPVNIGSGVGIRLAELAQRLSDLANTPANIIVTPSRGFEVDSFVADVTRMRALFKSSETLDPLDHLGVVLQYWQEINKGYADSAIREGGA